MGCGMPVTICSTKTDHGSAKKRMMFVTINKEIKWAPRGFNLSGPRTINAVPPLMILLSPSAIHTVD